MNYRQVQSVQSPDIRAVMLPLDLKIEHNIECAIELMLSVTDLSIRRDAFFALRDLICLRRSEVVLAMEKQKGLVR